MVSSLTSCLLLVWCIPGTWARFVALPDSHTGNSLEGASSTSTKLSGLTVCRNGVVQVVEWVEEGTAEDAEPINATTKLATRRVARVFEALFALEWQCPVLVRGRVLRDTIPAKEWRNSTYLTAKCVPGGEGVESKSDAGTTARDARRTSSATSGSVGSMPPIVDVSQDPVFTYEDSNMVLANRIMERGNGFTTHRRVAVSQLNEEILPSKKSRKKKTSKSTRKGIINVGGDSSTKSIIHVSDFLSSLHQNANQNLSPRFVRYGGKATASPCPQLAVDAALDYGVDSSLWLGSAGVISSAHFDLFDNLFCLVVGSKTLVVAPSSPENLHRFAPYPGSHPHARQMQNHFNSSDENSLPWPSSYQKGIQAAYNVLNDGNPGSSSSSSGNSESGAETCTETSFTDSCLSPTERDNARDSASVDGAVAVKVHPGEALWVPAGWIHHVTTSPEPEGAPDVHSNIEGNSDLGHVDGDDVGASSVPVSGFTAALSINRNAPELERFNNWLSVDGALPLPRPPAASPSPSSGHGSATTIPPNANSWSLLRVAAFLQVFLPKLLNALHEPDEGVEDWDNIAMADGSRSTNDRNQQSRSKKKSASSSSKSTSTSSSDRRSKSSSGDSLDGSKLNWPASSSPMADPFWPLAMLVRQSYSAEVRRHLGIAAALKEPFPCARLTGAAQPEDAAAAVAAAATASKHFKRDFKPSLRRLFLQPYLETVLSKLGGGGGPNARNPFLIGLGFAEWCLLTPRFGPPDAQMP